MSESTLVKKLERIGRELQASGKTDIVIINALKQEVQYAILEFVYNHPTYSRLVMYGGSLLRIAYELPRMSEDLDFQTHEDLDLEKLKQDLITHFKSRYNFQIEVTTKQRDDYDTKLVVIKFTLESLLLQSIQWKTIKIRFDVNPFPESKNFIKERIPIIHDGLAFSILTYPLPTLMASKVLAVLNRTTRRIGSVTTACKPRDIYDLLWYLEKKIVPDMKYIKAKGESYETLHDLFYGNGQMKGLKFRVMNLADDLFIKDLAQFFFDSTDLDTWLENGQWRDRFQQLLAAYKIYKIHELDKILFNIDFSSDVRIIRYRFTTNQQNAFVVFVVNLSNYWFDFNDIKIKNGHRIQKIESKVESASQLTELSYEYIGLFYKKIKKFIMHNQQVLLTNQFATKLIRATADKLKVSEQVYLDKRILENIRFEDLLQ